MNWLSTLCKMNSNEMSCTSSSFASSVRLLSTL